jgi:uncharacterized membrane protein
VKAVALVILVGCVEPMTIDLASCPPGGTTLTYESFGKPFLDANCQWCHASSVTDRHGAPDFVTFDTLADVHAHLDRIFVRAAGPNTTMPPGPDDPPPALRDQLAEWLACGAP